MLLGGGIERFPGVTCRGGKRYGAWPVVLAID